MRWIASAQSRRKTAVNVYGVVTKLFADACKSKLDELRVPEDNPTMDVAGPDRGIDREGPYLWPLEFLTLASDQGVPLHWRRIYALAIYLHVRAGELAALNWDDVHIDHGDVHIRQALNTDTGEIKTTKTNAGVRKVKIEHNLMPLLRAMHEEANGEGTVVEMPYPSEWAISLRRHLTLAGVRRADLFANDKTRRWLTFHDLRHTGITWRAIRGADAKKLQRSAGHSPQGQTDDRGG